ncbi:hypothetical protein [Actinomyces oris]|uniref:hypothetical protein n=1 Tax=Actinomyces oris TaxID=544580 RepID=UPI0022FD53B5|nr:hypothetical protein [Actinomyces oris]WCA42342.1 hypothetical protein PGE45_09445 [Actinomyces oris]
MSDWLTPVIRTFDSAVIDELFTALTAVGEGKRVAAGLTALAERHADNTRTDVVRVDPWNVILVVSSKGGCWSGREIELQVPLTAEESGSRRDRSRRAPTLWVSGSDGDLHRYVVPATLAYWVARKSAAKCGALRACEDGIVPSYDISGYLEPDWRDMPADSGLFLGLGLYTLAQQIDEATHPRERFAPAPQDEPLVLRREHPWSPADHEVPAGRIVKDILDVPYAAVFTAVFDDPDGVGRGVTPLMGFTHETTGSAPVVILPSGWYSPLKNEWAYSALRADRYVIHEEVGETLRELGAKMRGDMLDIPPVPKGDHDAEPAKGPSYIGPLPGEPHRRIRWDEGDNGVTIVLTIQGEDGKWEDLDSTHVSDTAEDGAVEQAEDDLLKQHGLCWADIDTEPEGQDEADEVSSEPTRYFNEEGEEIPEWEAQLTGLTGEETGE